MLEMWLDLELNCGSNFGSTAPSESVTAKIEVLVAPRPSEEPAERRVFSFLGSNLHPIPNVDPAMNFKKNIKIVSWSRFRPQTPNFLSFVF